MLCTLKIILLFVGGVSVGVGVGDIKDKEKPVYAEISPAYAGVILVNLGVILIIVTTLLWSAIPIK